MGVCDNISGSVVIGSRARPVSGSARKNSGSRPLEGERGETRRDETEQSFGKIRKISECANLPSIGVFVSSASDSEKSGMGVCGWYALSENIRDKCPWDIYVDMYAGGK